MRQIIHPHSYLAQSERESRDESKSENVDLCECLKTELHSQSRISLPDLSLSHSFHQANIGELDIRRTRQTLIKGNLALLQVQALIVSSFAGLLAFVLGVAMPENEAPSSGSGSGKGNSKNRNVYLLLSSTISMVRSRFSKRGAVGPPSSSALQPRRIIHHHHEATDPALKLRNGYFEFVLVLATGMLSASLSSAILGSFMCALVVVTRRLGGNPDNIG